MDLIRKLGTAIVAVALSVVAGSLYGPKAAAQTWDELGWQPTLGAGLPETVWAQQRFDIDGDGPGRPALVAATGRRAMALIDGAWSPLGREFDGLLLALAVYDLDGRGPQPASLIAGGEFTTAGGTVVNHIARWDGTNWQPLGSGMNGTVSALTVFDPDGDGPQRQSLIAGGLFATAGETAANFIARWDGSSWHPLGNGTNLFVSSLGVYDFDGAGPQPESLIVGGGFTAAGGTPANRIARWNGSTWQPFEMGLSNTVLAFTTYDPDGAGPQPESLIAGGAFSIAGGSPSKGVARWDGNTWQPFGSGFNRQVNALAILDPDGDGPQPASLIAGGSFSASGARALRGIARWDGSMWRPLGSERGGLIRALTVYDPDDTGPQLPVLVVGGTLSNAVGTAADPIAGWDGSTWRPVGSGINATVLAFATYDPDGVGPESDWLIAGGDFTWAGGTSVNRISRWDGSGWRTMGSGMNATVRALISYDPDGIGSQPASLIAGGDFTTAGGTTVNRIARWDGSAWQPMGSGLSGRVHALTSYDPDGLGPQPASLIAGGEFTAAGETMVSRIARWDGSTWQPLGSGLSSGVLALTVYDPDGNGPQPESLIAGGVFFSAGGIRANLIAQWNGSSWQPLGSGLSASVSALTVYDPDGPGPRSSVLVAGGNFTSAGGTTVNRIARWDGSSWQALGSGVNASVSALTVYDPDGAGPRSDSLVAGGNFTSAGGTTVNRIARWGGSSWQPLGSGMNGSILALTNYDFDGSGPELQSLI